MAKRFYWIFQGFCWTEIEILWMPVCFGRSKTTQKVSANSQKNVQKRIK